MDKRARKVTKNCIYICDIYKVLFLSYHNNFSNQNFDNKHFTDLFLLLIFKHFCVFLYILVSLDSSSKNKNSIFSSDIGSSRQAAGQYSSLIRIRKWRTCLHGGLMQVRQIALENSKIYILRLSVVFASGFVNKKRPFYISFIK